MRNTPIFPLNNELKIFFDMFSHFSKININLKKVYVTAKNGKIIVK